MIVERGKRIKIKQSPVTLKFKTKTGKIISVKGIKTEKLDCTEKSCGCEGEK